MAQDAGQPFDDAEAEAQTLAAVRRGAVQLAEFHEDVLELVFRDAGPCIPYLDTQPGCRAAAAEQDAPLGGVADRIREEVLEDAAQEGGVAEHSGARSDHAE